MKHITILIFILSLSFFATSTIAQDTTSDKANRVKYTPNEYEKQLQEMKEVADQAKNTYQKAQVTYKVSEKYMESSDKHINRLFTSITILFGFITVSIGLGLFSYFKSFNEKIKERVDSEVERVIKKYKRNQKEVLKKFKNNQDFIIKRLVDTEKWGEELRKEARLIAFNIGKPEDIQPGFSEVVNFFANSKIINIDSFNIDLIKEEMGKFQMGNLGIIIIEDSDGGLNPNPRNNDKKEINEKMIELAKEVCPEHGLFYFGPGFFPVDELKEFRVKNMVAFANAPAQLYGNLMNLLKFRSIIES